jgi:Flp pilus assembly protein TadD
MTIKTGEQIGYWKNGFTLFSHAIDVTERNEMAHYNLGILLMQAGRLDEAIIHFRKALEINPKKISALNNLACVYAQKKQLSDAIPLIQKALAVAKATGDESWERDLTVNLEIFEKNNRLILNKPQEQ